jgi:hypothetical protein
LYERVKQTKEIEAAGIGGLEECPFCEFKCIIDNPQQKLFACRNTAGGCGAVTLVNYRIPMSRAERSLVAGSVSSWYVPMVDIKFPQLNQSLGSLAKKLQRY